MTEGQNFKEKKFTLIAKVFPRKCIFNESDLLDEEMKKNIFQNLFELSS